MPSKVSRTYGTGLVQIASGTYAYIQEGGGAGISNAGMLVAEDSAIVLDTLATTSMAMRFLGEIRKVTGQPIGEVLLTHYHVDHVLGIQYFLPARVICHRHCREKIIANGSDMPERWARRRPQFAEDLEGIRVCIPDRTFDTNVDFHYKGGEARFFHPGYPAHVVGDALLFLPQEGVLFCGDIMFHGVVPAAFEGHIGNWLRLLDTLLDMDWEIAVPGHGMVGGKEEMRETKACLGLIYDTARRAFDRGDPPEVAFEDLKLGVFAGWQDAKERSREDIERAYMEFRGELETL
jgi:cyclase